VKEWGDKVSPEIKGRIDSAIERSRKALRGDDMNEIRSAQEELTKVFSEAGQSFYQQQAQEAQPQGEPAAAGTPEADGAGAAPTDDVVEADYEIVDDKK
jgi:molecular chaperone DnaK